MGPVPATTMLTSGIFEAYKRGVQQLASHADVREVARGQAAQEVNRGQPALFVTGAKEFLSDHALGEEVFGRRIADRALPGCGGDCGRCWSGWKGS